MTRTNAEIGATTKNGNLTLETCTLFQKPNFWKRNVESGINRTLIQISTQIGTPENLENIELLTKIKAEALNSLE